jgi:hypothetical protein
MPDGEVLHDDEGDQRVVHEGSTAILDYLNAPDFRGPLAVLTAAHSDVDIASIQHVATINVSPKSMELQAICAVDDANCVNIQVTLDFPVVCSDESEIIETLNRMHQQASEKLEEKKREKEKQEEMNVRPVPTMETKNAESKSVEQIKHEAYKKQRALLAARLERETKARAAKARRDAEAREIAATKFKEEMRLEAESRRMQKIQALEAQRRVEEAKRQSHSKQRALLAARLQREEAIRASIRQRQAEMEATRRDDKEDRKEPKSQKEEKELAARYNAIDDVGERAFAILVDLGMVIVSPVPRSPNYDASQDDEFVEYKG